VAVSDQDRLAEIRKYLDALYGKNVAGPKDLIDVRVDTLDWLVGEVERLRGLLIRLEWAGTYVPPANSGRLMDQACPACGASRTYDQERHGPNCWMPAELRRNDEDAPPPK
jgi:hypothetical protein